MTDIRLIHDEQAKDDVIARLAKYGCFTDRDGRQFQKGSCGQISIGIVEFANLESDDFRLVRRYYRDVLVHEELVPSHSVLPTYHAVRLEAAYIAAEARHAEWLAQIAKLRATPILQRNRSAF